MGVSRRDAKRGNSIAMDHYARIMPQYERLLSINPIGIAMMHAGQREISSDTFWNFNNATFIESQTGINPGDPGYNLVQANLIHVAIMRPRPYGPNKVQPCLQDNHDDITYISEHLDDVLRLFTGLHERQDASRATIEAMLSVSPAFAEGAL